MVGGPEKNNFPVIKQMIKAGGIHASDERHSCLFGVRSTEKQTSGVPHSQNYPPSVFTFKGKSLSNIFRWKCSTSSRFASLEKRETTTQRTILVALSLRL